MMKKHAHISAEDDDKLRSENFAKANQEKLTTPALPINEIFSDSSEI